MVCPPYPSSGEGWLQSMASLYSHLLPSLTAQYLSSDGPHQNIKISEEKILRNKSKKVGDRNV